MSSDYSMDFDLVKSEKIRIGEDWREIGIVKRHSACPLLVTVGTRLDREYGIVLVRFLDIGIDVS